MPGSAAKLILASESPRRRELLAEAGYRFEVRAPGETVESAPESGESAAEFVARLAYQKAAAVAREVDDGCIIGCDTVAECGGQILGKPDDAGHARRMLRTLNGRRHHVYSGLCLWKAPEGQVQVRVAETTLRMDRLSDEEIERYVAGGGWQGKAGALGYQDQLGWVRVIEGSESNVVGLPLELLAEMLG